MADKINIRRDTDPHPISFKEPKQRSTDINLNRVEEEMIFDDNDNDIINNNRNYNNNRRDESIPRGRSISRSVSRDGSRNSRSGNDTESSKSSSNSDNGAGYEENARNKKAKKAHLLWKFKKLNKDNEFSPMVLDMDSSLKTIENEVYRIEKEKEINSGTEVLKNGYITLISALELGSTKQDLINLNLTGWSRKVRIDADNDIQYEKAFNGIYEKYCQGIEVNPIIMLGMLTAWSGASIHMANKSNNIPNNYNNSSSKKEEEMSEPDTDLESIMGKMNGDSDSDTSSVNDNISEISEMIGSPIIEPVKIPKKRGRPKKAT